MEENNNALTIANSGELATASAAAMAKAEIETAYLMALKKPRSWNDVRAKILEACERPVFANNAEYSKPMGGRSIKGPSIRFAETAIQAAGNIRVDPRVLFEDDNIRKLRIQVSDLENNISYSKEIIIKKMVERKKLKQGQQSLGQRINSYGDTVYIVEATESELLTKQASEESKIIRTCGLRLIPQDIIEEAMEVAKRTRQKGIDPKAETNKILDAFTKLGVKPSDIEKYLGKPVAQIIPADIDDLRAIYTAIKEGEAKWSDYMQDAEIIAPENEDANSRLARIKQEAANKQPEKPKQDKPKNLVEQIQLLKKETGVSDKILKSTIDALLSKEESSKKLTEMTDDSLIAIISALEEIKANK